MNKILFLLLMSSELFASSIGLIPKQGAYEVNRSSAVARKFNLGTHVSNATQWGARAQWDYSVSGGAASTDIALLDIDGQPVYIPKGAVLTDCYLDVVTAPTSSTSSGSIAWTASGVGDLKAATFVSSYTTGSLMHCTKPSGAYTAATMIRFDSEGQLKIRIGSEALTAGKINVYLQYILSGVL